MFLIPRSAPTLPGALEITANKSAIAEGEEIIFFVNTERLPLNLALRWSLEGTASAADFEAVSGEMTSNKGMTEIRVKTIADITVEGPESFTMSLYTEGGLLLATSPVIAVNDTSVPSDGKGQVDFLIVGNDIEWIVPSDVSQIHALVVGGGGGGSSAGRQTSNGYGTGRPGAGGGLRWINSASVIPGEILLITVGAGGIGGQYPIPVTGQGGQGGITSIVRKSTGEMILWAGGGGGGAASQLGGTGSTKSPVGASPIGFIGGGDGGRAGSATSSTGSTGGGGGAGGYSGNGGTGYTNSNTAGAGGGGGGGYSNSSGGGVGLLGQGLNGRAGYPPVTQGGGGSNGEAGTLPTGTQGGNGGKYGGGATPATNYQSSSALRGGQGGQGAARIIWGAGRAYPSTQTGNI